MAVTPDETETSKILQFLVEEQNLDVTSTNIQAINFVMTDGEETIEVILRHDFEDTDAFPDLKERTEIPDSEKPAGLNDNALDIGYDSTVSINVVSSGAGYNNTLGAYTIAEDGTIRSVEIAYNNVKTPLGISKEIAALEKLVTSEEAKIVKSEASIKKFEANISSFENEIAKINGSLEKLKTQPPSSALSAKNQITSILNLEKTIKNLELRIIKEETNIQSEKNKIVSAENKILGYLQSIETKQDIKTFEYDLDGENGTELGLFIIADGDRVNGKYSNLDLETGRLEFVYNLGGADQRNAKITDSANAISLVYINGDQQIVLKGNIYHTTAQDGSQAINPDNAAHVIGGVTSEDGVYRLGFEDLKNLGDADFNDVVIDISVSQETIILPLAILNNTVGSDDTDDSFVNSQFVDEFDGKTGNDTLSYSDETAGVTIDIRSGFGTDASGNTDTFTSIENLTGSAFDDTFFGDNADNTFYGNDGNDRLYGRNGDDTIYGDSGNDQLSGGDGNDVLYGGDGNDIFYGSADDDALYGEDGDDLFYSEAGNDIIDGGEGIDRLSFNVNVLSIGLIGDVVFDGAHVDLSLGIAIDLTGDTDTLFSIENVTGSARNDYIIGDGGNNVLDGFDGNDTIMGGDGVDTINGDAGNDTLFGGAGADSLNGSTGFDIVDYSLDTAGINADLYRQTITDGGGSVDRIFNIEGVRGSNFIDLITGSDNDDVIYGLDGDDQLFGRLGNNTIYGGNGNDLIVDEGGKSTLYGGAGADRIRGGGGEDVFIFREAGNENRDLLQDFSIAQGDKIDISDLLTGFDTNVHDIDNFVRFEFVSATKSNLFVNVDGLGTDFAIVTTIQTNMAGQTVDSLLASGSIII